MADHDGIVTCFGVRKGEATVNKGRGRGSHQPNIFLNFPPLRWFSKRCLVEKYLAWNSAEPRTPSKTKFSLLLGRKSRPFRRKESNFLISTQISQKAYNRCNYKKNKKLNRCGLYLFYSGSFTVQICFSVAPTFIISIETAVT